MMQNRFHVDIQMQNLQLFILPNWTVMNFSLRFSLKLTMAPRKSHAYINIWTNIIITCVLELLFDFMLHSLSLSQTKNVVLVAPSVSPGISEIQVMQGGNSWLNFPPDNDWDSCARTQRRKRTPVQLSDVISLQVLSGWDGRVSFCLVVAHGVLQIRKRLCFKVRNWLVLVRICADHLD